jgi:hypothetical protein
MATIQRMSSERYLVCMVPSRTWSSDNPKRRAKGVHLSRWAPWNRRPRLPWHTMADQTSLYLLYPSPRCVLNTCSLPSTASAEADWKQPCYWKLCRTVEGRHALLCHCALFIACRAGTEMTISSPIFFPMSRRRASNAQLAGMPALGCSGGRWPNQDTTRLTRSCSNGSSSQWREVISGTAAVCRCPAAGPDAACQSGEESATILGTT